jgi:hypothetical protein
LRVLGPPGQANKSIQPSYTREAGSTAPISPPRGCTFRQPFHRCDFVIKLRPRCTRVSNPLREHQMETRRGRGLLTRIRRRLTEYDEPTLEEARQRIFSRPGFLASLGPEALEYIRRYDGPENMGPPLSKRDRLLRD